MNKQNQLVLNKCVEDLKHVKTLLSAIHREESKELSVTRNWNKRAQLEFNNMHLETSADKLYAAIGDLMRVR